MSGRPLRCTRCHDTVQVHEAPREFIDPRRYICGICLEPTEGQLPIVEVERRETRRYDPSIAAFPEGF